jgi:K+ transporter
MDGTDARIMTGAVALSAVVLPLVGLVAVRDASFVLTASTMVPLLLAAVAFLVVALVVDSVLTTKNIRTRDDVHVWLSKTIMSRLPAIEVPVMAGLLIAFIERDHGVLLMGAFGTAVLATVWWPGEQFFSVMRRRLQPMKADKLMDELLASTNGRLFLKTR